MPTQLVVWNFQRPSRMTNLPGAPGQSTCYWVSEPLLDSDKLEILFHWKWWHGIILFCNLQLVFRASSSTYIAIELLMSSLCIYGDENQFDYIEPSVRTWFNQTEDHGQDIHHTSPVRNQCLTEAQSTVVTSTSEIIGSPDIWGILLWFDNLSATSPLSGKLGLRATTQVSGLAPVWLNFFGRAHVQSRVCFTRTKAHSPIALFSLIWIERFPHSQRIEIRKRPWILATTKAWRFGDDVG